MKLRASIVITISPSWFRHSSFDRIVPRSGLVEDACASSTRARPRSVSPGRTGFVQRSSSMPGEPMLAAFDRIASTYMRMKSAAVCQPLATSPPKGPSAAASRSTWKGCGS
jgi:hypothetical protein